MRVSYVGESGFELHHEIDQQQALFKHVVQVGKIYDLDFYGAFAMNSMRLAMGYRAWGADLTTERPPLEAGLDRFVKTEDRDFVGRDALLARKSSDSHWSMHLLELADSEIDPFYSHIVLFDDEPVGIITSGAYGHRTGKTLALAYFRMPIDNDAALQVLLLGRKIGARICDHLTDC